MQKAGLNLPLGLADDERKALQERFFKVWERVGAATAKAGKSRTEVKLIAVSKNHSAASIKTVADKWNQLEGIKNIADTLNAEHGSAVIFGESYVQEMLAKVATLGSEPLSWHFIGHLQKNKAKQIFPHILLLHTLDSLALAQILQKLQVEANLAEGHELKRPVLVQVNIGNEPQKYGVPEAEISAFFEALQAFTAIKVCGLMCLPPYDERPEMSRPYFIRLRQLRDRLEKEWGASLPELSMGMSHDFEVAIEEGATLVRVGTDIFGSRNYA